MLNETEQSHADDRHHIATGRRNLLKALGATGLAVAANTATPNEWVKPVLDIGFLPAHAQTSFEPFLAPAGISPSICPPTPADIVLTADISGSISDNLPQMQAALAAFVNTRNLGNDKIGLIQFDVAATTRSSLTQDSATINNAINNLVSGGFTSIATGINAAASELTGPNASGNQKIIMLFSDGHTNTPQIQAASDVDPVALQQARDAASAAKNAGIRIITVGVDINNSNNGFDFIEAGQLMVDMASSSSDFFYVENLAQLIAALTNC